MEGIRPVALSAITLFFPDISFIMIAGFFPET